MWHESDLTFLDGPAPAYDPRDPGVETWYDVEGRACAYGFSRHGWNWLHLPRAGSYRFRGDGMEAVRHCGVVADEGAPRSTVLDSFFRTVVPLALQAGGLEVLHASAVQLPAGVLALCALSETGKSTLAYALHRRAHRLVADDAVVLDLAGPTTTITPVPFAMRLREASARHFERPSKEHVRVTATSRGEPTGPGEASGSAGAFETTDGWVAGRDADRAARAADAGPLALAAIAVLERVKDDGTVHGTVVRQSADPGLPGAAADATTTDATTTDAPTTDDPEPAGADRQPVTVERLAPSVAFRMLLPHAYSFSLADGERKRRMMQAYLRLVSVVPVHRVRFRTGLEHLGAITTALERLGAEG